MRRRREWRRFNRDGDDSAWRLIERLSGIRRRSSVGHWCGFLEAIAWVEWGSACLLVGNQALAWFLVDEIAVVAAPNDAVYFCRLGSEAEARGD